MKKLILVLAIIQISFSLFSQSYKISEIRVKGLKRTRYQTVLNILELKKGDTVEVESIGDIEQKLLKAKIFQNEIIVELDPISEFYADLNIQVEDKWTLIPLPFFSYSQDSLSYGGIFIESNLLGMKHSLISGVFYNDGNLTSFGVWGLPKKNNNTLSFTLSLNQGEKNQADFYGDSVNVIDNNIYGGGVNFTRDLTGELSGRVTFKIMSQNGDSVLENNYNIIYDNTTVGDFFTTGVKSTIGYDSDFIIEENKYYKSFNFELEAGTTANNNLINVTLKSTYSLDKDNYYSLFGKTKGSLIIPKREIYINSAVYGQFIYEHNIIDFDWGYITIPIFYEAGVIESHGDENVYGYHGPGGGLNLYMKKAAVPAMGLFYIYDIENDRYNFSFSIGASF